MTRGKLLVQQCDRCERELPLGSTKYRTFIEITSDFDGYLPEGEEGSDALLAEALEQAAHLDEETLESQVHLEMNLLLCPQCRKDLLTMLESPNEFPLPVKRKTPVRLQ